MQIVIEIDEARYKDIQRIAEVQLESNHFQTAEQIIAKGVPIEQKPKTGHWIMPVQDDGMSDPIYYQVRCSKCGFDLDPQTWHMELHQYGADKYCPNCGTKMVEPQKTETWNGIHAQITAPKGTFERIFNDANDKNDI